MPKQRRNQTRVKTEPKKTHNKTYKQSSDFTFIRIVRLAFFLMIAVFFIYTYALYEEGKLADTIYNVWESLQPKLTVVVEALVENPLIVIAIFCNNAFFVAIGYYMGKKGWFENINLFK